MITIPLRSGVQAELIDLILCLWRLGGGVSAELGGGGEGEYLVSVFDPLPHPTPWLGVLCSCLLVLIWRALLVLITIILVTHTRLFTQDIRHFNYNYYSGRTHPIIHTVYQIYLYTVWIIGWVHTHTHTHTNTQMCTRIYACAHTHSHRLSDLITHTLSLSLSLSHTNTHTLSLSLFALLSLEVKGHISAVITWCCCMYWEAYRLMKREPPALLHLPMLFSSWLI